jgi:hypothetical protein
MFKFGADEICKIFVGTDEICSIKHGTDDIYKPGIVLELPQYTNTFNLRSFIDSQDVDTTKIITVTNTLVQPTMYSGDLSGLRVVFVNNGEILGTNTGNTAL